MFGKFYPSYKAFHPELQLDDLNLPSSVVVTGIFEATTPYRFHK
jgi:hypothetical protein